MTIELHPEAGLRVVADGEARPSGMRVLRRNATADLDAERDVLGAIFLDESESGAAECKVWERVSGIVQADDFHALQHATVFTAISRVKARGAMATLTVVCAELVAMSALDAVGGRQGVADTWQDVASITHADAAARIVAELSARRRLALFGEALASRARDLSRPLIELRDGAADAIAKVRIPGAALPRLADAVDAWDARWRRRRDGREESTLPTGITALDLALSGGLVNGLTLLGARPRVGKTALAMQITVNIARLGAPVLFLSYEIEQISLVDVAIANLGSVSTTRLEHPQMMDAADEARTANALNVACSLPIIAPDFKTPGCPRTVSAIAAAIGAMKEPPRLIVVDHLRKMTTPTRHKEKRHELEEISDGLHRLGIAMGVPVLGLIHVGRAGAKATRPTMEDLKESGSLEENADAVVLLHNESKYPTKKHSENDPPPKDRVDALVPKRRGGSSEGYCQLRFRGEFQRFESYGIEDGMAPPSATTPDRGEGLPIDDPETMRGYDDGAAQQEFPL